MKDYRAPRWPEDPSLGELTGAASIDGTLTDGKRDPTNDRADAVSRRNPAGHPARAGWPKQMAQTDGTGTLVIWSRLRDRYGPSVRGCRPCSVGFTDHDRRAVGVGRAIPVSPHPVDYKAGIAQLLFE